VQPGRVVINAVVRNSERAFNSTVNTRGALKIMHVISSLECGGMEQFVLRLADRQRQRQHQVTILALRPGALLQSVEADRIRIHVLGGTSSLMRFTRGLTFVTSKWPHIIHAHNPTSLHYATAAKALTAAKVVLTDHNGTNLRRPSVWELRHTDIVVPVSRPTADAHINAYGFNCPVQIIPNGVEIRMPQHNREKVKNSLALKPGLTGINVARLDAVKDHRTLLQALAILNRRGLPLNLLIAGDGNERRNLHQLVSSLELDHDRIRFLGFRTDVTDLLAASDFFALSSVTEGSPLAVLEAMSQKLPVVATAVGGIPEVVRHQQDGLLVPPKSPGALADAIALIGRSPDLRRRMGNAANLRVEQEFSINKMVLRYEDLYFKLRRGHIE
jgi:glycosyltransferase involved in cell wall biosynthesis